MTTNRSAERTTSKHSAKQENVGGKEGTWRAAYRTTLAEESEEWDSHLKTEEERLQKLEAAHTARQVPSKKKNQVVPVPRNLRYKRRLVERMQEVAKATDPKQRAALIGSL